MISACAYVLLLGLAGQSMRVALVGFGRWGRNHARILYEEGWLAAVVDPSPSQLSLCQKTYPAVNTFRDLNGLSWASLDALILASPIECHVSQGLIAIDKGKHCLIEKPLALSVSDVELLASAANAAGVVVTTGHILDYHPAVKELVSACTRGDLGSLRYWHSARARRVPPRRYVSVVHELLWHDLSVLFRITGRLPDRVTVSGSLESDGVLALDYGDFYATLRGSQVQPLRESRIVVCGSSNTLIFDDEQAGSAKLQCCAGDGTVEHVTVSSIEPLRAELRHFVDVIRGRRSLCTTISQVTQILALIEMIEETCELCLNF